MLCCVFLYNYTVEGFQHSVVCSCVPNNYFLLMSTPLQSKYYSKLSEELHKRYDEKIDLLGGVDPYCRTEAKITVSDAIEWMEWPDVIAWRYF